MKNAKGNQSATAPMGIRKNGRGVGTETSLREQRQTSKICAWAKQHTGIKTKTEETIIAV
jgi:hypothetical protein